MRIPLILAAVAALALPATALAGGSPTSGDVKNAAKDCKALRQASGSADNFRSAVQALAGAQVKVTARNAFGKCVAAKRRATGHRADERSRRETNAARTCRTEQKADANAFRDRYGTNRNKRNAFGRCVVAHARPAHGDDREHGNGNGDDHSSRGGS